VFFLYILVVTLLNKNISMYDMENLDIVALLEDDDHND